MIHFGRTEISSSMDAENANTSETDVKEFRKKLRNRQSAQRARDRQKARLRWLERELAILTVKNQALQAENVALRNLIDNDKPQPRIQEPIRRKDTLPIKKRVQAQSAGGKSFNPDVDNIQSSPRKRPNSDFVPGRIQGKLKIINSETDKPFTVVDRVAVISPVLRNESCESDRPSQPAFISPDPTEGLKVSTRHNQNINQPSKDGQHLKNHLATNFVADSVKSDQDMRPINYSSAKKDLAFPNGFDDYAQLFNSNAMFNFQQKSNFAPPNYDGLIPALYSPVYPPGLPLVNFLPNAAMTTAAMSNNTDEVCEKASEVQKTIKLLREANAISDFVHKQKTSFCPEMLSAIYPSGFASARIPIPSPNLLSSLVLPPGASILGEKLRTEGISSKENSNQAKASLIRQKMNSFESDCSSRLSTESDFP